MPALTVGERTLFDITQYPAIAHVYICQPELVFEAPLSGVFYANDAIVALDYGTPTTGAYTDIEPEMTLEIWDASSNAFGSQRIRKAATADAIFVGRSPEGTHPGELSYDSGATIRVYKERRIWAKNPFIDSVGNQYKDELTYPGDDESQPPVANAGPDLLILSSTGSETIPLDALGDVPSFPVREGETIDTYLWDLGGGSVDTGTVNDSDLTATFGYGEYYVSLTVTDTAGTPHTCYKLVVIARPSDCIPVQITREVIRPEGVSLQLKVDPANLPAAARPNAKVLYVQYRSHADYGNEAIAFSGWLAPESWQLADARRQQKQVTIECHDVATRLKNLYGFPLTVSNESSENGWYRMPDCTIDRLTHHYLQWHTNVLAVADFAWSGQGGTYPLPRLTTSGASLWEQADRLAQAIGYKLTCNKAGAIRIRGDAIELPSSEQATDFGLSIQRTSVEITTLQPADYGEYSFTANQPTTVYWLRVEAVVASDIVGNISSVKCSAPGKTPAQGVSSQDVSEWLVLNQEELNVRAGNRYAARVNPSFSPLNLKMVKTLPVFEPADMEWLRVILPSDARARYPFLASGGNRYLIQEIVNTYDHRKLKRTTSMTLELEVVGIPAQTVVDPPPQASQYPSWQDDYVPITIETNWGDVQGGLVPGVGNIALILNDGTIAVTTNFSNPSWDGGPSWVVYDHSATLGTSVLQYAFRPLATNISGWILTPTELIYGTNLQGATPSFATQITFADSSDYRNIDCDFINAPGQFAMVLSAYASGGLMSAATVNGGSSWGSEVAVAPFPTGSLAGLCISPHVAGRAWVGSFNNVTDGNAARVRRTDNFGASYVALSNIYEDDESSGSLLIPIAGNGDVGYMSMRVSIGDTLPSLNLQSNLMRLALPDVGMTRISPFDGSEYYGPDGALGRFTIGVADNDVNKVLLCGINYSRNKTGVFITANALADNPTWVTVVAPVNGMPYTRCAFVNNGTEFYLFGADGAIGYSNDPYNPSALDSRIGDLVTTADVVGIAGF